MRPTRTWRKEKARVAAEQDRILLDYALEKERLQIKAEDDKRKAGAEAAKQVPQVP